MKNQNSPFVGIAALIIYLGCGIPMAFAQDGTQRIMRNFDVKPYGRLTVDSEIGTIDVKTAAQDEVKVIVTKKVRGKLDSVAQKALTDFEVGFEPSGSNVRIEGKFKRNRQYWMENGHPLQIHFQVTVPYQFNVALKTASFGTIHVGNLGGAVRAENSVGDLHFGEIQGTLWGKTGGLGNITLKSCQNDVDVESNAGNIALGPIIGKVDAKTGGLGNITLKSCQNDVDVESNAGNIELVAVAGKVDVKAGGFGNITVKACQGDVDVQSSVGNIHAEVPTQPLHPWTLQTSGLGKIDVTLSPKAAVNIDAETQGSISSDIDFQDIDFQVKGPLTEHRLKGTINGGGPLLKLRTSLGEIRLKKKLKQKSL